MSEPCPCGSGSQYNLCCEPYLNGTSHPATPEALMRSRYSAYVRQQTDYLVASWHPSCDAARFAASIEESYAQTRWLGLRVIETALQPGDNEGFVTFCAQFRENEDKRFIYERSRFLREDQRWYYIDGVFPPVGRNDRCPCGSGSKYKKCCGQS